ncbi:MULTISPECIES: hypothetical protein [Acinetobacter]|uniref:hypothetical protein n=1 Tax=Acinetobacter TaxID=469 RepID=UPI000F73B8C9|nr:hypothetical protein [Acinetobacter pittii]
MIQSPSSTQKRNRNLLIQYFAKEINTDFAIDLEMLLLSKQTLINQVTNAIPRKEFSSRLNGYCLHFLGTSALEEACQKYNLTYQVESTNGRKGGEYGLAISENFVLAFSNNLRSAKDRSTYQTKYAETNGMLGLSQAEFDFGDCISHVKTDEDQFYVVVGFKRNSLNSTYDLVFTVPDDNGNKIFDFYIKDLVDAVNIPFDDSTEANEAESTSLDQKDPSVKLKLKRRISDL